MQVSASLTEGSIIRALTKLSVPIVLANILQSAYQITDTFWVGRLSTEAVAAVSLSFPVSFLLIAIGGGLPMAGAVLIAQYKGRGDESAVNHVAAQTLLMIFIISLLLSFIGYILAVPIMRVMGAAPSVLPDAVAFLRMTFLGFIFVFGFFVYQSLLRGLGQVIQPMLIVLGTVLLNLVLDPLFIFGYGSIPAMGVAGAAMATLCTQALATVIGLTALLRGTHGIHLQWSNFRPDFAFMRRAFRIGFPSSIEQSTRALGMTVMTILVAGFGTTALAAYGIGVRVLSFVIIPALGLSMATSTLVGQSIGAGKVDRAERATIIGCFFSFIVLSGVGLPLFLFAHPLAAFFIPGETEAIILSAAFIRVIAFGFGFIGVQMVLNGTFRGAGQTVVAMVLAIVSQWVLQFPLAYILSHNTSLGLDGIWWSHTVSNVLAAGISVIWYLRGDWKRKRLLEEVVLQSVVHDEVVIEEEGRV